MSSSATSTNRNCDGCGLPPRISNDGTQTSLALKRCSRCHQTFYHDVECQRRHFAQHKKDCRRITATRSTTSTVAEKKEDVLYRVEERPGRGRCLVANQSLAEGQAISNHGFSPLVPPVLNQANRQTRCALCFGMINPSSVCMYESNAHSPLYPVWCCSESCRRQGMPWLQQEEQIVVNLIAQSNKNIQILPTAILLYRLLRNVAEQEASGESHLRTKLEQLESHADTKQSPDEEHHTQAVVTIAKRLLIIQANHVSDKNEHSILQSFTVDCLSTLVSSIKTNGFSICNGESVALGIGLFEIASNMNHSCRPNALQTFVYGKQGTLPVLRVTACTNISPNDEICISYIDNSCPRDLRRQRLKETYHFECKCESCCSSSHDNVLVGMKCPETNCTGTAARQDDESAWECNVCGNTDFTVCTSLMEEFDTQQTSLVTIKEQECLYTRIKNNFSPTSWYVFEAGEQLAQSLLDSIDGTNAMETQRLCARAFAVFDELINAPTNKNESWRILKRQVLLYKRAKLRLFLYPDPRMAMSELQDVMQVVSRYYPKDHEFVEGLRDTIAQAFS